MLLPSAKAFLHAGVVQFGLAGAFFGLLAPCTFLCQCSMRNGLGFFLGLGGWRLLWFCRRLWLWFRLRLRFRLGIGRDRAFAARVEVLPLRWREQRARIGRSAAGGGGVIIGHGG